MYSEKTAGDVNMMEWWLGETTPDTNTELTGDKIVVGTLDFDPAQLLPLEEET